MRLRFFIIALLLTSVVLPTHATAAELMPPADDDLSLWAVQEGGARIYAPDAQACKRASGLSYQFSAALSQHFDVPAYSIHFVATRFDVDKNQCGVSVETPSGIRFAPANSIMRTYGGIYLAHIYAKPEH